MRDGGTVVFVEVRQRSSAGFGGALASIDAGKEVSRENAEVIATALRNADIDLVGGDGGMFENLIKAVSLGKSIEGLVDKSPIVQDLMQRYLGVARPQVLDLEKAD